MIGALALLLALFCTGVMLATLVWVYQLDLKVNQMDRDLGNVKKK